METITCPRCDKIIKLDSNIIPGKKERRAFEIYDNLTRKQKVIVTLLLRGLSNKHIGIEANVKEQVVKNYLRAVYDKIGVNNRLELIIFVRDNEYLSSYFKERDLNENNQSESRVNE